ncbi:hypothetical protein BSNT_09398 [Bacillus subtilis subsp. natto BEST195]|nr:hypothetical protein BSNT_09398 [Bacillus subtilis subsp. natto BEST195]
MISLLFIYLMEKLIKGFSYITENSMYTAQYTCLGLKKTGKQQYILQQGGLR